MRSRPLVLTLAFFAINLPRVLTHSLWGDEAQAWLIARESHNLGQLFHNMRYEGHPALWHLCLWILQLGTHNPLSMQIFQLLFMTVGAYLVARWAPFSWLEKILLLAGYYISFEYLVIARSYALGAFLAFVFCTLSTLEFSPLLLFIILGLLANTTAYGCFISGAFALFLLLTRARQKGFWPGAGIYVLLGLFAAYTMKPAPDALFATGWHMPWDLGQLQGTVVQFTAALFPFADPKFHFWNNSVLLCFPVPVLALILAIIFGAMIFTLRSVQTRIALGAGFFVIFLFNVIKAVGSNRHFGQFWILYLGLAWLAPRAASSKRSRGIWITLLLIHALAGVEVALLCLRAPFTQAKNVATEIKRDFPDVRTIIAAPPAFVSPVSAYLDLPLIYPHTGKPDMFVRWNKIIPTPTREKVLEVAQAVADKDRPTLVILGTPIPADPHLRLIRKFAPSIEAESSFDLYEYVSLPGENTNEPQHR